MEECVLFSPVGFNDPVGVKVKDKTEIIGRDGAMLHIVRCKKPKKVYLYLTKDTKELSDLDNRYEEAIHYVNPECIVEKIDTDIDSPHSFDKKMSIINELQRIAEENKNAKILVNITSGTPQMNIQLAMATLIDTKRYEAVQVPFKTATGKNLKEGPYIEFGVTAILKENLDNDPTVFKERCETPKLMIMRKPMIQAQILSLIKHYNYDGALSLLQYEEEQGNKNLFSKTVIKLLEHGKYRQNLSYNKAKEIAEELGKVKELLYANLSKSERPLFEYLSTMEIKYKRNELNDFMVRLEVFIVDYEFLLLEKLSGKKRENFLKKNGKFDIKKISICMLTDEKDMKLLLDEEKIQKLVEKIERFIKKSVKMNNFSIDDKYPNSIALTALLDYYKSEEGMKKIVPSMKNKIQLSSILLEVKKWVNVKNLRNDVAHTITDITEDKIKKIYGGTVEKLVDSLKKNLLLIPNSHHLCFDDFDIYGKLNNMIKRELKKEREI